MKANHDLNYDPMIGGIPAQYPYAPRTDGGEAGVETPEPTHESLGVDPERRVEIRDGVRELQAASRRREPKLGIDVQTIERPLAKCEVKADVREKSV